MKIKTTLCLLPLLALSSASAATVTIQTYNYFSTTEDFSDGDISVFDGNAKWSGVTDSTGATTHTGTFGDGTVLDYRFVGSNRTNSTLIEHVNGGGAYLTSTFTVVTYGASGGANAGLDVWHDTNPDDVGTFDSTPDSDLWTGDHVAGGANIAGVIDVSNLSLAQVYFIYGSYKNAATITLTTDGGTLGDLGTLSLAADGLDNGRLVIQEVTIDNSDGTLGIIDFNYTAQDVAGRGRFSGVIVDGTLAAVPEPSATLLGGIGMLLLLRRRR